MSRPDKVLMMAAITIVLVIGLLIAFAMSITETKWIGENKLVINFGETDDNYQPRLDATAVAFPASALIPLQEWRKHGRHARTY